MSLLLALLYSEAPVATEYVGTEGEILYAGQYAPEASLPNDLLDLIAAAPSASWVSVSDNTFDSIWPHVDYRSTFGAGTSGPSTILQCWASFAWDDVNHRAIFWGGGHANSNCNEVYDWNAHTRSWRVSFMPAEITSVGSGMGIEPVDGPLNTPQSSHTYSSNLWLPILQRFVTFGGAASSSGGAFQIRTPSLRLGGCYTLDMTLAGLGYVGGTTGSNPKRGTSTGVDLTGAEAWYLRDWFLDHADPSGALSSFGARTNGNAAYREEGGHDVVYFKGGAGYLFRIEFVDDNYLNDVITRVGQPWTSSASANAGGLDPVANLFISVVNQTYPIEGFDLDLAGATNHNFRVAAAGLTGSGASDFITSLASSVHGCLFDPVRDCFVVWGGGGSIYTITRPSDLGDLTTGWTVLKLTDDTLDPRPSTYAELGAGSESDTGVSGKWRYSESLDLYIGVQGRVSGNVWMFKPSGWTDPRS